MDIMEIIKNRHSVRAYQDKPLETELVKKLTDFIQEQQTESGLTIELVCNNEVAFSTILARYGWFTNVKNFIVISGKKSDDLEEKAGYFGEKIVLKATEFGLGTCWVGATYRKKAIVIEKDAKLVCVISVGYIEKPGVPHKSKTLDKVVTSSGTHPGWFISGVESALLAPTAINQQKFTFSLQGNFVEAKVSGLGFYTKVDLGIAKYHFEIGAGKANFSWK